MNPNARLITGVVCGVPHAGLASGAEHRDDPPVRVALGVTRLPHRVRRLAQVRLGHVDVELMHRSTQHENLAAELLRLIALDDEVRARLASTGALFEAYHPEMEAVHRANAARLRELIAVHGWPDRAKVGEAAARAAWRIVQHAIGEPEFLRAMLPIVASAPHADPAEVAMLDDRIRVFEGRLQRYGTQYDWNDAGTAMVPMVGVEDPETVDARRAAVGLPPIEWSRAPAADEARPSDLEARERASEEWLRRVGWR